MSTIELRKELEDRALAQLLLLLTVVTGIVDAVSFLGLGHVFVANMTGNVVFLAFAASGTPGFSVAGSLLAIAAFLVGAVGGGRMTHRESRSRTLRDAAAIKVLLLAAATTLMVLLPLGEVTFVLIVLLGATMATMLGAHRAARAV